MSNPTSNTTNNISVNLLPQEIIMQRKQGSKIALINKLSIGTLVILVFSTSATLALRVSQNFQLTREQTNVAYAEEKVTSLSQTEQDLLLLKQRLGDIKAILGGDTKRTATFNTVVYLTPPSVQISSVAVDKSGNMVMTLSSNSLTAVETLISNLSDTEKNAGLISRADLDSLSLGRDALYRFSLKVYPK